MINAINSINKILYHGVFCLGGVGGGEGGKGRGDSEYWNDIKIVFQI